VEPALPEAEICVLLLVWKVIVPEDDSTVKLRPDTLTFVTLPVTVAPESVVRVVEVVVDVPMFERSSV
jgi:hypothetical protein